MLTQQTVEKPKSPANGEYPRRIQQNSFSIFELNIATSNEESEASRIFIED